MEKYLYFKKLNYPAYIKDNMLFQKEASKWMWHTPKIITGTSYSRDSIFILILCLLVCLMVFNATFSNISVISWQSVLLEEKTGGPEEKHWHAASYWQTISHNVVLSTLQLSTLAGVDLRIIFLTTGPFKNPLAWEISVHKVVDRYEKEGLGFAPPPRKF